MSQNLLSKETDLGIRKFAILIIISNFVFLLFALIFYNGQFNFWLDPFSNLGNAVNNPISARIFTAEMILNSLIFLSLDRKFQARSRSNFDKFNTSICAIASFGFFVGGFSPDDTMHLLHVAGMALAVASLWLLLNSLLFERQNYLNKAKFIWLEFFLQAPILLYAGAYFLQIDPASYAFQKISFFSLALVFYCITDPRIQSGLHGSEISG